MGKQGCKMCERWRESGTGKKIVWKLQVEEQWVVYKLHCQNKSQDWNYRNRQSRGSIYLIICSIQSRFLGFMRKSSPNLLLLARRCEVVLSSNPIVHAFCIHNAANLFQGPNERPVHLSQSRASLWLRSSISSGRVLVVITLTQHTLHILPLGCIQPLCSFQCCFVYGLTRGSDELRVLLVPWVSRASIKPWKFLLRIPHYPQLSNALIRWNHLTKLPSQWPASVLT